MYGAQSDEVIVFSICIQSSASPRDGPARQSGKLVNERNIRDALNHRREYSSYPYEQYFHLYMPRQSFRNVIPPLQDGYAFQILGS